MQGVKLEISEQKVRELAAQHSDTRAAKILGIAVSSFFLLRRRYGIPSFTQKTGNRRSRATGKLLAPGEGIAHPQHATLRADAFDAIDTADKAYFFGLLATDGHTSAGADGRYLSIELQEPDGDVLESLRLILNHEKPLKRLVRSGKKPSQKLIVYSRQLVESLIRQGITLNTEEHCINAEITRSLRSHCVRGLLDGDGHIDADRKNLYLCGCSLPLMHTVKTWVHEELAVEARIKERTLASGKAFYTMTFGGAPRKLLSWAYPADAICIARKRLEAEKWIALFK